MEVDLPQVAAGGVTHPLGVMGIRGMMLPPMGGSGSGWWRF